MTTTTTTWRDFIEQLTAEQIADLERCEREQVPPGMNTSAHFINAALSFIAENEAQKRCAHIPTPADAIGPPTHWVEWDDGVWARGYTAWRGRAGGFEVQISAWQFSDGRPAERDIAFEDTDDSQDMTADRARELAALLLEAAGLLDRLNTEAAQR